MNSSHETTTIQNHLNISLLHNYYLNPTSRSNSYYIPLPQTLKPKPTKPVLKPTNPPTNQQLQTKLSSPKNPAETLETRNSRSHLVPLESETPPEDRPTRVRLPFLITVSNRA